mmetsp:Transcript_21634/g.34937  ORF Transcript_21634/g.34937 Transcript_21634/m.34937 type:complete len:605 (-) Transcript_21634:101-1915(-)
MSVVVTRKTSFWLWVPVLVIIGMEALSYMYESAELERSVLIPGYGSMRSRQEEPAAFPEIVSNSSSLGDGPQKEAGWHTNVKGGGYVQHLQDMVKQFPSAGHPMPHHIAEWGMCKPSQEGPKSSLFEHTIRVCVVGLPYAGISSPTFGHVCHGVKVLYSMMRRRGLGPWLDNCKVQLQFNAPVLPVNHTQKFHKNASWPTQNAWIRKSWGGAYNLWRPFVLPPPQFFRGVSSSCDAIHHEAYIPKDDNIRCGFCNDHKSAIELPFVLLRPTMPSHEEIAEQEANATLYILDRLINQEKQHHHSSRSPPVLIMKLDNDQMYQAVPRGIFRQGNARHNRFLHRAVSRALSIPNRYEARYIRITQVVRGSKVPPSALGKGINDVCKPRRIRNKMEVEQQLAALCKKKVADTNIDLCKFKGNVDFANLNTTEQMRVAASSDIFISYHGSAIGHHNWMPDDAILIEVLPSRYFSGWWAFQEEDSIRNMTWVFASHSNGSTIKNCVKNSENIDLKPWRPGPFCGGRRQKDTCRAWNASNVIQMLESILPKCELSLRVGRRQCLKEALVEWQKKSANVGYWVFPKFDRPKHMFMEIADDGKGKDDVWPDDK